MLHELEGTPLKKHGQLYEDKGTPYENLGTLCSNLGMLSMFAGMPYELKEGIREELRDPRELPPLPAPSRKPRRRREERLSQRKATLRAHLGTPSVRFGMPQEPATTSAESSAALAGGDRAPHKGGEVRDERRPHGVMGWRAQTGARIARFVPRSAVIYGQ